MCWKKSIVLSAAFLLSTGMASAQSCPPSVSSLSDNRLYVLDGTWRLVKSGMSLNRTRTVRFAYGIKDERDIDGGIVLVKTADLGGADEGRIPDVELHRDSVKRVGRGGQTYDVPRMTGDIPLVTYQDAHENGRESRQLRNFHSRYKYKGRTERSTNDPSRRRSFVFREFDIQYQERSAVLAFLFGRAAAGVKPRSSDDRGVKRLRSALKYYGPLTKASGGAICFSLEIDDDAKKTRINLQDFDHPDLVDGKSTLLGRGDKWEILWK